MIFEIKHRWNGSVLFSLECASPKLCVEAAVSAKADLGWADLRWAIGDFATPEESDAMLREIAKIVLEKPERLAMGGWHGLKWDATHTPEEERSCGTAHCLAGWAQALCPLPLLRRMDPVRAGIMLIPTAAHMFYKTNEEALEFLKTKRRAAKEAP